MHLPDGIITSPAALAAGGCVAAGGLTLAHRRCRAVLEDRTVAVAGVMAAFIFALQMVNFPIGFGVSGHLMGGTLAAVILGPWLGALVVALVVIPQCLLFADGGLLALGINVTTMAIVGALVGGSLVALLQPLMPRPAAWFLASWGSIMAATVVACAFIVMGSPVRSGIFIKSMIGVHSLIGIGEGIITVAILSAVAQLRPDLTDRAHAHPWRWRESLAGFALAASVVVLLSPVASGAPDGLEASLESSTPAEVVAGPVVTVPTPAADYELAGISDATLAGILAGLIGVMICLGVAHALLRPSGRARRPESEAA